LKTAKTTRSQWQHGEKNDLNEKLHSGFEDGTTGAMSTVFLNAYDLIGKRITVRTKDENGVPCEKRGKLAEILEEWH
jgi:flagellar hook assembly protein FlgD